MLQLLFEKQQKKLFFFSMERELVKGLINLLFIMCKRHGSAGYS